MKRIETLNEREKTKWNENETKRNRNVALWLCPWEYEIKLRAYNLFRMFAISFCIVAIEIVRDRNRTMCSLCASVNCDCMCVCARARDRFYSHASERASCEREKIVKPKQQQQKQQQQRRLRLFTRIVQLWPIDKVLNASKWARALVCITVHKNLLLFVHFFHLFFFFFFFDFFYALHFAKEPKPNNSNNNFYATMITAFSFLFSVRISSLHLRRFCFYFASLTSASRKSLVLHISLFPATQAERNLCAASSISQNDNFLLCSLCLQLRECVFLCAANSRDADCTRAAKRKNRKLYTPSTIRCKQLQFHSFLRIDAFSGCNATNSKTQRKTTEKQNENLVSFCAFACFLDAVKLSRKMKTEKYEFCVLVANEIFHYRQTNEYETNERSWRNELVTAEPEVFLCNKVSQKMKRETTSWAHCVRIHNCFFFIYYSPISIRPYQFMWPLIASSIIAYLLLLELSLFFSIRFSISEMCRHLRTNQIHRNEWSQSCSTRGWPQSELNRKQRQKIKWNSSIFSLILFYVLSAQKIVKLFFCVFFFSVLVTMAKKLSADKTKQKTK